MNKLSKEKRDQIIALAMGVVVLVGVLYALLIRAQDNAQMLKQREIDAEQASLDQATKLKTKAPAIQEDLDKVKAKLDKIENTMASGDLYSWVILTVNRFKSGYNVEIPNFSREELVGVGMYGEFPYEAAKYTLKGSAYFHDFGKFIADFENAFPYIRVQNIDLMPQGDVTGQDMEKLTFKFELVVPLKPKETSK